MLPAQPGHDGPRPAGLDRAPVRLGGMPWTLWRHVAWELFRTFAVTVSIIVTVIAFGAAAKPLAEDAIGADTVLKFVGLAMVPMMQYAMPFAAGLAATLTLHRFATDNEVLAMSAAGMSPRAVMAPVFLLGLPLLGVMLVLVLWTIPQFFTRMQELVTADATQMLLSSVERGEALRADRLMIYADAAREVPAPEGVRRRLALDGHDRCARIGLEAGDGSDPWRPVGDRSTVGHLADLLEFGVQPDILVCRTEHELSPAIRHKLARFTNVAPFLENLPAALPCSPSCHDCFCRRHRI